MKNKTTNTQPDFIMFSKVIKEEKIKEVNRLIAASSNILLTAHISPDGDALGATLGLFHYLVSIGKKSIIMVPNRYPAFYEWMPGIDKVVIMEEAKAQSINIIKKADLIFCLDYNSLDRVNGMKPILEQSKAPKILLDHHLNPDIDAVVKISHPEISSTSELVFRLICRIGGYADMNTEGAQCIYTGMMTDTGGFTYNSNSREIYTIIGYLLDKGIDKDDIYRRVFNTYSEDRLRLLGYCLTKMEILDNSNTAIISLTLDELNRFNYQVGDTEGFVNIPMQIKHINRSVLLREDKDKVKLSFRSQGDTPVNTLAEQFGGGGHKNAAGGESYLSLDKTLDKLRTLLRQTP